MNKLVQFSILAMIFMTPNAFALMKTMKAFKAAYPNATQLHAAKCTLCHAESQTPSFCGQFVATLSDEMMAADSNQVTDKICATEMKALNPYGTDLANHKTNDQIDFKAVELIDSDADTFNNLDEIVANFMPGDANSHPPLPTTNPENASTHAE